MIRDILVSNNRKHEIVRYRLEDRNITLVVATNYKANALNQLNYHIYLFDHQQQNVYRSDSHHVIKRK